MSNKIKLSPKQKEVIQLMRVVDIMDMALYGNPQYGEALEPPTIKKWKGVKPESEIPKGNKHLRNTKKVKQ